MARDYSEFKDEIIGSRHWDYQKDHILQILAYYNKRNFKSWTKTVLLQHLIAAEKTLGEEAKRRVKEWMSRQYGLSPPRFSAFMQTRARLENSNGSLSPLGDFDDDEFLYPGPFGRSTTMDCVVCMESLEPESFPTHKTTPSCAHSTTTCTSCLIQAIESQIPDVAWDQIKCPECPELLDFASVKQVVSPEAFERYGKLFKRTFKFAEDSNPISQIRPKVSDGHF
jgi:hypothetical protein